MGDDDSAVLGEGCVAADMVAVEMRVDEIADRVGRYCADRIANFVVQWRELSVDHQDAIARDSNRNVSAPAFEHIEPIAEIVGFDFDAGKVVCRRSGRRRCGRWRRRGWLLSVGRAGQLKERCGQSDCQDHNSFSGMETVAQADQSMTACGLHICGLPSEASVLINGIVRCRAFCGCDMVAQSPATKNVPAES